MLRGWAGRPAVIVPILEPGISLTPMQGVLAVDDARNGVLRIRVGDEPEPFVSLFRATFLEAGWVPSREDRGLSLVQGGTRVDVFLNEGAA